MPSLEFSTIPLSADDIEQPNSPLASVNIETIFQLIANTPELALQGNGFVEAVRGITNRMQNLFPNESSTEEEVTGAIQGLLSLLQNIAPHFAEGHTVGIDQATFDSHKADFIAHVTALRVSRLNEIHSGSLSIAWAYVLALLAGIGVALLLTGMIGVSNSNFAKACDGLIASGLVLLSMPSLILYIEWGRASSRLDRACTILNISTGIFGDVDALYLNYCKRNDLAFFQSHLQASPGCFYELAAKLYATQLVIARHEDDRDYRTLDIFRAFAGTNTPEGQKFNNMLREASCDSIKLCLENLVNIPVSNDGLTLKESHIFGPGAASYLLNLVDNLRAELGLKRWDLVDRADAGVLGAAIAQYTGESLTPVYTSFSSTALVFAYNPIASNACEAIARPRANSY